MLFTPHQVECNFHSIVSHWMQVKKLVVTAIDGETFSGKHSALVRLTGAKTPVFSR